MQRGMDINKMGTGSVARDVFCITSSTFVFLIPGIAYA